MSAGSSRAQLANYLESILERLGQEGFEPSEEDLSSNIVPAVVGSVRRLSAGAPAAVRDQLRQALTGEREPGLQPFREAVRACLEAVAGEGGEEGDGEDGGGVAAEEQALSLGDEELAPSDEELQTFSAVVQRLWSIDEPYRLIPGEHFQLNHQSRAGSIEAISGDRAPEPLFAWVDEDKFMQNPCSRAFVALLDNYEREDSVAEQVTESERSEMSDFLRRLMRTPHMRYVHKVLVAWDKADALYSKFAAKVFEIWFSTYSLKGRRGPKASSGFEHVFVGEEKQSKRGDGSEIVGLHSWVQFWREERAERVNYRGYVGALTEDDERVVSVRFDWADDDAEVEGKSVSTFAVGTSVAFEFAMLTCAFLGFDGEASISGIYLGDLGPCRITAYDWDTHLGKVIRTVYLEA